MSEQPAAVEPVARVIDALADAREISRTYASLLLSGQGSLITRLDSGGSVTTRRERDILLRAAAIWPDGAAWPDGVPRPASGAERMNPAATARQKHADNRCLNDAIAEHGFRAVARLGVMLQWARDDAAAAVRAGDRKRAAMRGARAERLARVIAELDRTGRGRPPDRS